MMIVTANYSATLKVLALLRWVVEAEADQQQEMCTL
jgi:hypothetical protein